MNVLITGSNRGIGLELCRTYAARDDTVFAVCRKPSGALERLAAEGSHDVRVVAGVDVAEDGTVESLRAAVGDARLDVLINNAGILTRDPVDRPPYDNIRRHFEVNTFGPLRVTHALTDRLRDGAKVGIVTSLMGSIADNTSGGSYAYRLSKAAVNMAGVNLAHELRDRGIAVVLLHPGMVATDMTGGRGITVEESVAGLVQRLDELSLEGSGTFVHADGRALPW